MTNDSAPSYLRAGHGVNARRQDTKRPLTREKRQRRRGEPARGDHCGHELGHSGRSPADAADAAPPTQPRPARRGGGFDGGRPPQWWRAAFTAEGT